MSNLTSSKTTRYFAAQNSYHGFISHFSEIFRSEEYDRIYVLKGGPGTGKSSFMKKVAAQNLSAADSIEEIYCSSDPHSLDGVILSKNNAKIAILDGTAPHERDAVIPGAIDEIINLGEHWDSAWLRAKKDSIISLSSKKKNAYKAAYNYLSSAGKSNDYIISCMIQNSVKRQIKIAADNVLSKIGSIKEGLKSTRLISSFGCHGSYKLDTLENENFKQISVCGSDRSVGLLISHISKILQQKSADFIHFPNALDPGLTDAILFPASRISIIKSDNGDVDADALYPLNAVDKEMIRAAETIHDMALKEAVRWFKIASDIHFELESIYGEAMNFESNDTILRECIEEIDNIFEKNT